MDRIADAFTAAEQTNFKLMHSFDMSYSVCDIYWNQTFMADILSRNAGSSATYRWNSNILVSTYGGDQVVDQYGDQFFQGLKDLMKESNAISLAPALTSYSMQAQTDPSGAASSLTSDYPSIDGYLNWQAWPLDVRQNISIIPDQALQGSLKKAGRTGPYIMGKQQDPNTDIADSMLMIIYSNLTVAIQRSQRRQPLGRLGRLQRYSLPRSFRINHWQGCFPARHHRALSTLR